MITTIEGKVVINPFGDSPDCSSGVYVGGKKIDNYIAYRYAGQKVKITIELLVEEKQSHE